MLSEYIIKQYKILYGLVLIFFVEAVFIMFSTVALIAVPPLGIIMFGLCFLFGLVIKKVIKKYKKYDDIIKQCKNGKGYRIFGNSPVYCFSSPLSTQETARLIKKSFQIIGDIKEINENKGYLKGSYRTFNRKKSNVEFYIEHRSDNCNVRAVFRSLGDDDMWDLFLKEIHRYLPEADLGVTYANREPYVVGVLYLGTDTKLVHNSVTTGGTSMTGFLLGDMLFGPAGAIVFGNSGKIRTHGSTETQFSNTQLARLVYNNGRIYEGPIVKNTPLYNEIMVNMRTLQR